jgi:hypothetical protein
VTLETILLFSISIIVMLMIFQSFQGMNQKHNKMMLEEEMYTIGNSIVKKMTEMNLEAISSQGNQAQTTIRSEFWIPATIGGSTYTIKLSGNQIILETSSDPYITVEVPFSSDIKIADNSTVYSSDYKYVLQYDQSGTMYFINGGVLPSPDYYAPSISIDSPEDGATISNTALINVTVWDNVGVTRVEYFVNGEYNYTGRKSFNWSWDTTKMPNGICNVTAVAYDAPGNWSQDIKMYTISNTELFPPIVTVVSPADGSNTTFRKPVIKASISDDEGIKFLSISLIVDGEEQVANATVPTGDPKLTTITYTPSVDMTNSNHVISLHVEDIEGSPEVEKNWAFEINDTDVTNDTENPVASITSPVTNASIITGSDISVTYVASDGISGINNLSINVTRNDGNNYYHLDNVSIYPTVIKNIAQTWTFTGNKYESGKSYNYNITVYDRNGNKGYSNVGTFMDLSQAGQLEVVTTGKILTNGSTMIENITLRDTAPLDMVILTITKIKVSWNPTNGRKIKRVKIDGITEWSNSGKTSGTQLTLSPSPYTISGSSSKELELWFTDTISGRAFTIEFTLSDGTTKTVTFDT